MPKHEDRGHSGSEAQRTARGKNMGNDTDQPVSAAEMAKSLGGIHFPADKRDLENHARQKGARNQIIETIRHMPDREYDSMADVEHEFSQAAK